MIYQIIPARFGRRPVRSALKPRKLRSARVSAVTPPQKKQAKVVPVRIQEHPGVSSLLSEGGSTLMEVLLAISFVPFLVFFMLTWKGHAHFATVRLFPKGGTAF